MATEMETEKKIEGWSKTVKDVFRINRALVLLKCALFIYFSGMSAVIPYLSVHMRTIGLSVEEIGTVSAFLPFASFLGPPIAGMISDKLGQYRHVLILGLIFTAISQTALLATDARFPDGFKDSNSTGVLMLDPNVSFLELEGEFSVLSNVPVSALRFSASNGSCCTGSESCLPNKLLTFEAESNMFNMSYISGNVKDLLDKGCSSKFSVNVVAIKLVDLELDERNQKQHMWGFWTYCLVRAIYTMMASTCFCLFDATVLAMVKEHNGDYGKQRLFSMLGLGIASPMSGVLVDWLSAIRGYRDYSMMFYFSDVLLLISCFLVWKLDVKAPKAEGSFLKNLAHLITIPEIPIFLFFMFLLGNNWGCLENYLFIFLLDLKAPNYLLGLTLTVGCFCGIPFLFVAKEVIAKIGVINMLVISYLTYTVRLIGYSLIEDPWMSLPFEAIEFLSYHALQCTACTFCSEKAPKGLLATLTALFGAFHYQLGRGSGAFVGGLLIPSFGIRQTYRLFAYGSAVVGVSYWLIHHLILKRLAKRRESAKLRAEPSGEVLTPFIQQDTIG